MASIVRFLAYGLALIVWLCFAPIWLGAVATLTVLTTFSVVANVVTGRDVGEGHTALDDMAALWPKGFSSIVARMKGPAATSVRADDAARPFVAGTQLVTMLIYAVVFWAAVYFGYNYLIAS